MKLHYWILIFLLILTLISIFGFLRTRARNQAREQREKEWNATKARVNEMEERINKEKQRSKNE
jgi:cell division protein FtsB